LELEEALLGNLSDQEKIDILQNILHNNGSKYVTKIKNGKVDLEAVNWFDIDKAVRSGDIREIKVEKAIKKKEIQELKLEKLAREKTKIDHDMPGKASTKNKENRRRNQKLE
jgi:hypothetical protein